MITCRRSCEVIGSDIWHEFTVLRHIDSKRVYFMKSWSLIHVIFLIVITWFLFVS